jgi:hypothetical protein
VSNYISDMKIWVGDLDGYINIDEIDRANEEAREARHLQAELDEIGGIPLLAGKGISAHVLDAKGITPSDWRWATHQAEHSLHDHQRWVDLERSLVKGLLSLGKPYALSRYSRWERIAYASALTATLPLGFKALLEQYLIGESIAFGPKHKEWIRSAVGMAEKTTDITAYERTGMIQSAIHQVAYDARGPSGPTNLSREGTRMILSLARLHFSMLEMNVRSLPEIQSLDNMYEAARSNVRSSADEHQLVVGRCVRNWQLRHLHPLTHLFPYAIRHAIARGIQHHAVVSENPDRAVAVNELALAHCGILRMRQTAKTKAKSR